MSGQHAEQIALAAEADGLKVSLRYDYSGRGMFGETTAAVTVPNVAVLLCAVAAAVRSSTDPDDLIAGLWGVRTDDLGRDIVVY